MTSSIVNGAVTWMAGLVITVVLGLLGVSFALSFVMSSALVEGMILGYFWLHLPFIGPVGTSPFGLNTVGILSLLVPIVLLVASGFHVSSKAAGSGFRQGASIAVGYVMVAAASMGLVFLASTGASNSAATSGPEAAAALGELSVYVVIAGIIYPVVFGGLGGLLADQL